MRVVEPGHVYDLTQLDGEGAPLRLVFVNREEGDKHPGTQTQEVLRTIIDMLDCLVDRTNHCDSNPRCAKPRWEGNDRIIKSMTEAQRQCRLAILYHEERVLEKRLDKGTFKPEEQPVGRDGHYDI